MSSRKQKLHSTDDDLYLILEDDTFIDDKWKMRLEQLIHNTPDDFDMIKLGYWGNRHCVDKVNKFIYQANGPTFSNDKLFYQGNSGYAVKRGSVKKLLAALKEKDLMDIDGAFLTSPQGCVNNCIKVYAASGAKQVVSDINMGTMRVPTKKNGMLGNKKELTAEEKAGYQAEGNSESVLERMASLWVKENPQVQA